MGSVYRVEDPRLARQVAIKVHKLEEDVDDPAVLGRFVREAQTTGRLEHPSIPPVYEMGETENGAPYFALKLLDGITLATLIAKLRDNDEDFHVRYDVNVRYQIATKLCDAISFAHSKGVIHRDIKPDNVMLGNFGEVWLVDWGLAGPSTEETTDTQSRLTSEPTFMGTIAYAAPEQILGSYTPATDQYSLGATLYELFCLEPAHPGTTPYELLKAVTSGVPKPAESFFQPRQGRVPREVSLVLAKMLSKEPKDRYSDVAEVRSEIAKILGGDFAVVCPHTLTKKTLIRFNRFMDNHNYWFMPILLAWLLYPLYALSSFLAGYLFASS